MKLSKLLLLALCISLFASCSSDDDTTENNDDDVVVTPSKGDYEEGFFILNEGSTGQGTVSFSNDDFSSFTKDVYSKVNGSDALGKFAQNIFFDGDKAYIIAGGSNVINVVNRYTFKLIAKVDSGLVNPRYGVVKDGKAYVTNANTYPVYDDPTANPNANTDDYVAIINLATNTVESKIDLNTTGNRIVLKDDKLYITEPNSSDKLSIVNITSKTLETPVTVGYSADSMEEENGTLYILRAPYTGRGELVKVKLSDKSVSKITFPESLDGAGLLDIYQSKIYYTAKSSVYVMNTTADVPSTDAILTSPAGYLYGFAVHNDRIFISDGGDFKQDSKAYIYNLAGAIQKELAVGVGPNGFYFND